MVPHDAGTREKGSGFGYWRSLELPQLGVALCLVLLSDCLADAVDAATASRTPGDHGASRRTGKNMGHTYTFDCAENPLAREIIRFFAGVNEGKKAEYGTFSAESNVYVCPLPAWVVEFELALAAAPNGGVTTHSGRSGGLS